MQRLTHTTAVCVTWGGKKVTEVPIESGANRELIVLWLDSWTIPVDEMVCAFEHQVRSSDKLRGQNHFEEEGNMRHM